MNGSDQPKNVCSPESCPNSVTMPVQGCQVSGQLIVNTNNIITNIGGQQSSSKTPKKLRHDEEFLKLLNLLERHKTNMKKKSENIFEVKERGKKRPPMNEVYIEMVIMEGDFEEVNREHETVKTDEAFKTNKSQEIPINFNDIFQSMNNEEKIVLTKGIAGIGKTISVNKFILDWAEEKANKDVDAVFLFPFREINLIAEEQISFIEFLQKLYPFLEKAMLTKLLTKYKVVLIFDGLDESRLPLNFKSRMVSNVTEKASVGELFINLIRGHLLPSSLIWVTSRPAAANQIPSEYVGLFTEVRGFTDQQKEEYFRKRIKDETKASKIISHVKKSRSLYIMCHIPVFCWITATALDYILKNNEEDIDITLTEMYIKFLLIQMNMKNQKYDQEHVSQDKSLLNSNKDMILKLAELAFKQLMKENIIFYEEDLQECGFDVSKDSEYIGMIAEIIQTEDGLHEKKIFSFVHLTVQEFLAALYVFVCYRNKEHQKLDNFFKRLRTTSNIDLHNILIGAIKKAKQSQRRHLDLFVRFLLGISLESSQKLLIGLFTDTEDTTDSIRETTEFIKRLKAEDSFSDEASVNMFYCLLELKDKSLYEDIQSYLHSHAHLPTHLTSSVCTLMVHVLLMSEQVLDEFNTKKYTPAGYNYQRFIPVVRCCRKALFDNCDLTAESCEIVASALQSSNSPVKDLDLSNNDLRDLGVKLISDALKSPDCKLHTLRLSNCNLTAECCESLSSALQSPNVSLRDLDLSNNDLQDSGVKVISAALKSPECKLQTLRLSGCMVTDEGCSYLASALISNPSSHLKELDLSYNHPQHSGVQMLSQCTLDKLNLDHGEEFRITAGPRKYACDLTLDPNTVNAALILSEDNRKATCAISPQPYPDHPDRFDYFSQVLCRESLTGCHYWEAELSESSAIISVTYKDISRKGKSNDCFFAFNEKTWSLEYISVYYIDQNNYIDHSSFRATHGNMFRFISAPSPRSNRVGVYLDWSAGTLSFYSVSDTQTLTHLHTFNTTFTQPLYVGFGVEDKVSLCELTNLSSLDVSLIHYKKRWTHPSELFTRGTDSKKTKLSINNFLFKSGWPEKITRPRCRINDGPEFPQVHWPMSGC
ncbi:NACHT, LRR and PYD domains-containing protein 3-like [Paramisgurnus dabryanus]|uniref:NACHT, LRR and PYD domains-containing protein 3-like n=1 Tax=Paramisgurnus dabryanus TaxID=90735 RepID=UPI0031F40BD3